MRRFLATIPLAAFLCGLVLTFYSSTALAGELDRFKAFKGNLSIAGGTAHIPVMKEAAKRIMTAHPAISITVAGGGTGVGVQQAGEGLVSIGNTGRALSEAEVTKYGLKSFAFAIDGVAAVVHPQNPLPGLTMEQVQKIFAGTIKNWKEVGGKDQTINLYTREEASGTREVFWEKMLKKGSIAQNANVVASNGAMKTAISKDPAAIGYVSIGHIDSMVRAPLLDGVLPSQENAINGKYQVVRKLYMNTKGEPQGLTKAFIEYIQGPEGAGITKESGYIPTK